MMRRAVVRRVLAVAVGLCLIAPVPGWAQTFEELYNTFLQTLVLQAGDWENLPASPTGPANADISKSDYNSYSPAIVTDGTKTYVAWSQPVPTGGPPDQVQREIYLLCYDTAHPENGWQQLDGSATFVEFGTGGGISKSNLDSVAPRLVVQQNPHRLWVVWQEGQMNDVLEQVLDGIKGLDLGSMTALQIITALFNSTDGILRNLTYDPTYIQGKYIDLGSRGTWSTVQNISQNDAYSLASRPDVMLTSADQPYVTWDYMRFSEQGGTGATKAGRIYNNTKNTLSCVYGAKYNGSVWQTIDGASVTYNTDTSTGISGKNKWDICAGPRAVKRSSAEPVVGWLYTQVISGTDNTYRGITKVHVRQYSGSWAGIGTSDNAGGITPSPGLATTSVCSQIAMAPLSGGRLAVTFTRSGPELIPNITTPVPVTQICGRMCLGDSTWTDYDTAWNDLSASLFYLAASSSVAVNGNGNPVIAWVDAGLNVFAFEWDMASESWGLLGLSYWLPSAINETTGLQGGVAVAIQASGQPLIAWHSAPISDELKALVPSLTDTSTAITEEFITQLQAALGSATFDVKVRAFVPPTPGAVITDVKVLKGNKYAGGAGSPVPFAEMSVQTALTAGADAVTVTTPTASFDLALRGINNNRAATFEWHMETYSASDIAKFTDGAYTVTVFDEYGETLATTTVSFRKSDGNALVQPTAIPAITAPVPASAVLAGTPTLTFAWNEWTTGSPDPVTSKVGLTYRAFAGGGGEPVFLRTLAEDTTASHAFDPAPDLTAGPYKVTLLFADGNIGTNGDNIPFICAKMSESNYDLMVTDTGDAGAAVLEDVSMVRIWSTVSSRGSVYEFDVEAQTAGAVSAVVLITPDEERVLVPYSYTDQSGAKWWQLDIVGTSSLLERFGQGVYGIEAAYTPTRDVLSYYTSCVLFADDDGSDLPMPGVLPVITAPAPDAAVDSPFDVTWSAWSSLDAAWSDAGAGIYTGAWSAKDDSVGMDYDGLANTAVKQTFDLPSGAYDLEVAFYTMRAGETNRGATSWSVINAALRAQEFAVSGDGILVEETWTDTQKAGNGWKYNDSNNQNQDLPYITPGGATNDGHVRATMGDLGGYLEITNPVYWPCYLMPQETDSVTADFTNGTVSIALKPSSGLNLRSGTLRFFVGYLDDNGQRYYCTKASFDLASAAADDWNTRTMVLSDNPNDWETPVGTYTGTPPSLGETLSDPPVFGFAIVGAEAQPSGTLGFDSFKLTSEGFAITLSAGWNLVSFPLYTTTTIGEIFSVGRGSIKTGNLWSWDAASRQYVVASDDDAPEPLLGYWVYSSSGGTTRAVFGTPATGEVDLKAGWNLVGPANRCLKPNSGHISSVMWAWQTNTQSFGLVGNTDYLNPGCAYWVFANEDVNEFYLDFTYEIDTQNWVPDEIEFVDTFVEVEDMFNELCSDEEAFNDLDVQDGGRGEEPLPASRAVTSLASCRTKSYDGVNRRLVLDYTDCAPKATGHVYISRQGPPLHKYYLIDFQDDFQFMGIDIDGQLELERLPPGDGIRNWELRVRDGDGRRLTFDRDKHQDERHFKAILVITAAVIAVKTDTFEVDLPRDGESGIKGDAAWGSGVVHLGDRLFELFTSEGLTQKLVFNRDVETCICPKAGPLYFAGRFDNVALDFIDSSDGIAGWLDGKFVESRVSDAFRTPNKFKLSFTQSLNATALYTFNSTCGTPALNITEVDNVRVPIDAQDTKCALSGSKNLLQRADDILSTLNPALGNTRKNTHLGWIHDFLMQKADKDGCRAIASDHVKTRVKQRLDDALEWNDICTP
ncbi:MAG: hypothetical protein A3K19_00845 [Lentisphaerae bacterium RIFOXYB12_FULL_65_16]|nr:MAG: hypothetical protein A3K19_00845 [Lentisphaerae bacterium RIFOXYB12_FULL_65_16]